MIQLGTIVTLVFDTDVPVTEHLKKNIELISRYCSRIRVVFLAQVLNLEDELVRCTDVKQVQELTKSRGKNNFKSDFCRLKTQDCRNALERHHVNVDRLWATDSPKEFSFIKKNASSVKVK